MLSELQRESAGLEKTVDSLSVIDSVNETQESYREIHFTKIISAYIKPTSEAIGGFLISFRLYKAESSLAGSNIMSGLFLKVPELVLRNLLCLSEKCKQICLAADTYEVQIVLRFRLFPSLPTVLRHSERNSSFDKSQWQPPRRVLPNFSKLFSFVKDMQKSVPSDTLLRNRMIAAFEKRHTSPKTHKKQKKHGCLYAAEKETNQRGTVCSIFILGERVNCRKFCYGYTLDFSCSLSYNVAIILFSKNYNIGVFV